MRGILRTILMLLNPIILVGFLWYLLPFLFIQYAWPKRNAILSTLAVIVTAFVITFMVRFFVNYITSYTLLDSALIENKIEEPEKEDLYEKPATYLVSTREELIDAINNIGIGETIAIKNGTYTDWGEIEITAESSGTELNRNTLRAEKRGGVIFNGADVFRLNIRANYWNIDGIIWDQSCETGDVSLFGSDRSVFIVNEEPVHIYLSYNTFIGKGESSAHCDEREDDGWQSVRIKDGAIGILCDDTQIPFEMGRLLNEPSSTTLPGDVESLIRSSMLSPIKIKLIPESGIGDVLHTIQGCSVDGAMIQLAKDEEHPKIAEIVVGAEGNIRTPGEKDVMLPGSTHVFVLKRIDGEWHPSSLP